MLKFIYSDPKNSKGRLYKESDDQHYRSPFQRDRDRIIHCSAFRKLKQKTQVFIESESDYYRTRLTHTLEVSQITRTLCRALNLNEDLGECISLSHDLGHPPFGHSGEDALNLKMSNFGGYNHNEQTLRIVTELENKYPNYNGLNLTWESLEGIVKHNGKFDNNIPVTIKKFNNIYNLNLNKNPSLEAQIASISDDVAYNNHDIDDAVRANLISLKDLISIDYFKTIYLNIFKNYKNLSEIMMVGEIVRRSINIMVNDIIKQTKENIINNSIQTYENIHNYPNFLVTMSKKMLDDCISIKKFLYLNVYNHKYLQDKRRESQLKIYKIFDFYFDNFSSLPLDWRKKLEYMEKERIICDYISGMTDRYASTQYNKING